VTDDAAHVRRLLADIPDLLTEAQHYLTPGTAPKDPDARHATSIFKIPIVAEIADLLDTREKDVEDATDNRTNGERRLGVLPTLGLWVSLVYVELEDLGQSPRDCCPLKTHTVAGECDWLAEYAEPIIELHPDFVADIEKLWTELRQACRIRREYTPRCPNCGFRVEGVYGSDEDQEAAWYRCTGCPKTFVLDAELKRLALTQPAMTLRQIAGILGLSCRDVYAWHANNRYAPVGTNSRGQKLFELEHVRRAALSVGRRLAESA